MIKIFTGLFIIIILFFLSIEDVKTMTVPVKGIIMIFISGAVLCISGSEPVVFHINGWLLLSFTAFLTALVSGGLGGGDVRLFSALGFALGVSEGIRIFMLSFLLSGLFVLMIKLLPARIRIINRVKIKKEIPFVPFIAVSAFLIFTENLLYCL